MACPLCGDECHCSSARPGEAHTSVLIDPDAYDPSEQQFAATLDSSGAAGPSTPPRRIDLTPPPSPPEPPQPPDAWRYEVASRVTAYRARRRRFDPDSSLSLDFETPAEAEKPPAPPFQRAQALEPPKVIEFPRATAPAVEELAEPILERPRILEAEEQPEQAAAPTPAITLDDGPGDEVVLSSDLDLPLRVAPIGQRGFAALVDWLVVTLASGVFTMIFLKLAGGFPHTRLAVGMALLIPCFFWGAYQYLFLVHAAATPGMQMAGLGLETFEGKPASRRLRRWRALAMLVSCMSVGLGFIWAMVDEDALCWHDRITRTYESS